MKNWNVHRTFPSRIINLESAFKEAYPKITGSYLEGAVAYLKAIEEIQPLRSRQAVAIALVAAANYVQDPTRK